MPTAIEDLCWRFERCSRKLGISRVIGLSATPFFLRGSGYAEGSLFQWKMSDISLMDAIECGIVKLPRVPVAENIPGNDMPMFRGGNDAGVQDRLAERAEGRLKGMLRASDTLVVCWIDRLGCNYEDVCDTIGEFRAITE